MIEIIANNKQSKKAKLDLKQAGLHPNNKRTIQKAARAYDKKVWKSIAGSAMDSSIINVSTLPFSISITGLKKTIF